MTMNPGTAIHWFRKGLRLHDNPSLLECFEKIDGCLLELRPIFILDPTIANTLKVGSNRWRFLHQTLHDLDSGFQKIGSRLFVIRGKPEEVLQNLFKNWNVKLLTFEADIEPYSKIRDEKVKAIAGKFNVKVIEKHTHTMSDPYLTIKKNNGKAPLTYQKFISVFQAMGPPDKPKDAPMKLRKEFQLQSGVYKEKKHGVPSLEELGVNTNALGECKYKGGETEALKRMNQSCADKAWICKFEKPNTSPNSLQPSTTVLSPYLKFGCLSPRLFYFKLKEAIGTSTHTKPPVSLIGQLLWREFYYVVGADTPNYDKMVDNPICCQVPWDNNQKYLQAWTYGQTGYPFIDAIMRQLREEGWIHHLARHAVACFLTRGDLWISWEEGQTVFEELLLDQDWALNAGNWMWLSASAFFHQFYRVYSPVAFGKKTDKNGDYIRKYVPEIKNFPLEYIYEPWKAPKSLQKQQNCIIGKDYPNRIVIHEEVHKINIKRMSAAYKMNKTMSSSLQKKHSLENSEESKHKKRK